MRSRDVSPSQGLLQSAISAISAKSQTEEAPERANWNVSRSHHFLVFVWYSTSFFLFWTYRSPMQGALVAQLANFSFELLMRFSQNMTLYFSYTIVQKRQEWLKTRNQGRRGGAALIRREPERLETPPPVHHRPYLWHFVWGPDRRVVFRPVKQRRATRPPSFLDNAWNCWRIENAVDGETSSNKTSCLSLTSCLGNPCVPPFIIMKHKLLLKKCPQINDFQDWWNSRESSGKHVISNTCTVLFLHVSQYRPMYPAGHVQV